MLATTNIILLTNSQTLFIGCFSSPFGCCFKCLSVALSLTAQNSTYIFLVLFQPFSTILCLFSFLLWAVWHFLQPAFFLCRIMKLEGILEIIQSQHFLWVLRKLRPWEVKVSCCCIWSLPIIHLQIS